MTLTEIYTQAIAPALALLPKNMTSEKALVMLFAIGLQESRFESRYQIVQGRPGVKGPARGFWQFELGSEQSRGGVWGVYMHRASSELLRRLCLSRGVKFEPRAIWLALETDDVLAAGVARLLLYTDPLALPELTDTSGAWTLYAKRTWRPGKPHIATWPGFHAAAVKEASKWAT